MSKTRRFEGKVVVITAATAGIGYGIAERVGQEGAKVVISSRRQENVDASLAKLRSLGIECCGCACHVGDKAQLAAFIHLAVSRYGKIDTLVSNAAVNPAAGPILSIPEAAIDKILDINIKSAILLAKAAVPHMPSGGSLVFVSSYTAFNPASAPISMYAVSKTALVGLTKALAEELAPDLRVNCIAPGTVPTKFASLLVDSKEAEELSIGKTLLGRLGTPGDMAAAVAYLASDDASYVTGETIVVSGGMQSRL